MKYIISVLFMIGMILFFLGCGEFNVENKEGLVDQVTQNNAIEILKNTRVEENASRSVYQLMLEVFESPEFSFERQRDGKIEVSAMGFLKIDPKGEASKRTFLSYIVDVGNKTCELGTAAGNLDWDYIMDSYGK